MPKSTLLVALLAFNIIGCATPAMLFPQRSDLVLENKNGLLISTSKTFEMSEFERSYDEVKYYHQFIVQNANAVPIDLFLDKASVEWTGKSLPLLCQRVTDKSQMVRLSQNEKVHVQCSLTLPRKYSWPSDELVNLKIPTSNGTSIEAKKLIRAGDFQ